jgi:peptide/nickel transport system substrate-binding protein
VSSDILDGTWVLPATDGSGRDRKVQRAALTLLQEAGYRIAGRQVDGCRNGKPFALT